MKHLTTLFAIIITLFALTVSLTAPVQAASRTWVASTGLDTNPCTRAAPCASFDTAYNATDPFGEINCVDSANFGFMLIQKSITISCEGGTAGIFGSSDGIEIIGTAASDVVYLKGLDIEGLGPKVANNTGIGFFSAGTLHVEKCRIHGFVNVMQQEGWGITFQPNGTASLFVADTVIADNGLSGTGGGILVQPASSANASVSLERVQMTGNNYGLDADGSSGSFLSVSVADSLASGSFHSGIIAETTSGRTIMMVNHTTSSNNGGFGLKADGANAEMIVGSSVVSGNNTGVVIKNGATLLSYQDNRIDLNSVNGTPLPALALH
jgi:hypothetical protein